MLTAQHSGSARSGVTLFVHCFHHFFVHLLVVLAWTARELVVDWVIWMCLPPTRELVNASGRHRWFQWRQTDRYVLSRTRTWCNAQCSSSEMCLLESRASQVQARTRPGLWRRRGNVVRNGRRMVRAYGGRYSAAPAPDRTSWWIEYKSSIYETRKVQSCYVARRK